jgi:hypothetical protein
VQVQLDRAMSRHTLADSTGQPVGVLLVCCATGAVVPCTAQVSSTELINDTCRLQPTEPLAPGTRYTVVVTSATRDVSGNAHAGSTTWFETEG